MFLREYYDIFARAGETVNAGLLLTLLPPEWN